MRFTCLPGCTKCCEQRGFVYVSDEDIDRLAAFLGVSAAEFDARYVYRTKNTRRLRMRKKCPFLKSDGCSVHPAKPTQCRTFPFWPELVENEAEWAQTASWCPGMNTGDIVPLETLKAGTHDMRAAYPHMYK